MDEKEKETLVTSFNTIRKVCEATQGDLAYHRALAEMLDRVAAIVQEKIDISEKQVEVAEQFD